MQKRRHPKLKLSLLSCAIAVAAGGLSQSALAVDLCTGDSALTISSSRLADNCTLDTTDARLSVDAAGKIGNVNIQAAGVKVSNAGLISGSSSVLYSDYDIDATLSNSGRIISEGNGAYATVIYGDVNANINNSGTMMGDAAGATSVYATGLFINENVNGNLNNSGSIKGQSVATGNNAYASGIDIQGSLTGDLNNSGRISGEATVEGSYAYATGMRIGGDVDGDISNSGKILGSANAGYYASATALYISGDVNGHIGNSGLIEASAAGSYLYAYGLSISGDLNGGLGNSGTIRAKAISTDNRAYVSALYIGGEVTSTINNSGLIHAYANAASSQASAYALYFGSDITSTGKLVNSGAIRAEAVAYGNSASAYGIYSSSTTLDADFINSGVVGAEATAYGSSAYAYAVDFDSGMGPDGRIVNTGTIKAMAVAEDGGTASALSLGGHTNLTGSGASVYASMFGNASIVNSGSIVADIYGRSSSVDAYAIDIDSDLRDNARILNTSTGTIRVTAESFTSSASITGIQTGSLHEAASIINNGRIVLTATGHGDDANIVGIDTGDLNDDALIANNGLLDLNLRAGSDAYGQAISTGSLNNNAAIVNTGTISVDSYGLTSYASATGIETGELYDTTSIVNTGTIKAMADADGSASAYGIDTGSLYDTAMVSNRGTIVAHANSRREYSATAYGIDVGGVFDDARVVNSGRIDVRAEGREDASAYGIYSSSSIDGSISNTGSIKVFASAMESTASAYGIYGGSMTDGSVSNSGSIDVRAEGYSTGSAYGIYVSSLNGASSVTNSGTITAAATDMTSSASAWGIYTSTVSGTSTVTNSGRITLTADGLFDAYGYAYGIEVGSVLNDAKVTNAGMISAKATSVFSSASAWGIYASTVSNNAEVKNSGMITVSAVSDADEASAYGIRVSSVNDAAVVSNTGVIKAVAEGQTSASAYGLYAGSLNGTASVGNTGAIVASALNHAVSSAGAIGIRVSSLNGTNTVTNSGMIVASARNTGMSDDASAYAYGIRATTVGLTSSITNSGTIVADASVDAEGVDADAIGIRVTTLNGTVTNTGKIVARNNGASGTVAGIYTGGGTGGQVVNSGSIIGGVVLNGATSLTNSGDIVSSDRQSFVGSNYTQQAGGSFTLVLRDTSNYGNLQVNGTADFTASNTVKVAVDPAATIQDGDVFTDVIYATTLTTPMAGIDTSDSSLFWNFEQVNADANGFDLEANLVDPDSVLAGSGLTLTATQAGLLEDALTGELGEEYAALVAALNSASGAGAVVDIVEQMGPALTGAAAQATRIAGAGASNAITARIGETRGASSGDAFTQNALWIKPFLGKAEQDGGNGVSGYDVDTTGYVIGIDGDVTDTMRVGVAVATASSEVDGDAAGVDIDTTQFTVYSSYVLGNALNVDADLSYGSNGYDSSRKIGFAGSRAVGTFDGTQLALGVTVGKAFKMSETTSLTPSLLVRYSQVELDGYTETGAGAFNLTVADTDEDAILALAKADYALKLNGNATFLASFGVGMDTADTASATAQLGGTGATFVSNGVEPESTLITAGLGYRYVTAKNLEINAAYDLESRSDFMGNTLSVKFKLPF
jgi:cytoskeletal protein CcmA (bactofilin family)